MRQYIKKHIEQAKKQQAKRDELLSAKRIRGRWPNALLYLGIVVLVVALLLYLFAHKIAKRPIPVTPVPPVNIEIDSNLAEVGIANSLGLKNYSPPATKAGMGAVASFDVATLSADKWSYGQIYKKGLQISHKIAYMQFLSWQGPNKGVSSSYLIGQQNTNTGEIFNQLNNFLNKLVEIANRDTLVKLPEQGVERARIVDAYQNEMMAIKPQTIANLDLIRANLTNLQDKIRQGSRDKQALQKEVSLDIEKTRATLIQHQQELNSLDTQITQFSTDEKIYDKLDREYSTHLTKLQKKISYIQEHYDIIVVEGVKNINLPFLK